VLRAGRAHHNSKGGAIMSDAEGREAAPEVPDVDDAPLAPVSVEIAVGNGPISDIAVTTDGSRLVVTNFGANSVSVIDADRCRVVNTVEGIDEPFAVATGGLATNRAYVSTASPAYDAIAVIDVSSQTVVATHQLALSVSDLAVCPLGQRVYASRNGAKFADVAVLDTATGRVDAIDLGPAEPGTTTECVRVDPDGNRAYVGVNGPAGGRLVMIGAPARSDETVPTPRPSWRQRRPIRAGEQADLRVVGSVAIGLPIRGVALSPNGALAYVASCDPDVGAVVDVIDTRTDKITSTRKLGDIGIVTGLTLSADGDRAYLVSDDRVTVLCTLTHDVIATLGVAAQPSCLVESPDATHLYIADYSGTITVTPVASTNPLAIESAASERGVPAAWLMPELEPALT
jgi:YVTN family beta-propeller protein